MDEKISNEVACKKPETSISELMESFLEKTIDTSQSIFSLKQNISQVCEIVSLDDLMEFTEKTITGFKENGNNPSVKEFMKCIHEINSAQIMYLNNIKESVQL